MYQVYVLRSDKTGRRYVGSCQDLEDRLGRHNRGESAATRHGVPWKLIHTERFETRGAAMQRERYFKTGKGRDELDRLESWSGRRGDRSSAAADRPDFCHRQK